jgi:hypothetical protein
MFVHIERVFWLLGTIIVRAGCLTNIYACDKIMHIQQRRCGQGSTASLVLQAQPETSKGADIDSPIIFAGISPHGL